MHFDGNPSDMATIIVAFIGCMLRPIRRALKKDFAGDCFTLRDVVVDFLNGTVLVPFTILIGTTFSKGMLKEALETNKLFLAIGGAIGLMFVIREFLNEE